MQQEILIQKTVNDYYYHNGIDSSYVPTYAVDKAMQYVVDKLRACPTALEFYDKMKEEKPFRVVAAEYPLILEGGSTDLERHIIFIDKNMNTALKISYTDRE